MLINTKLNMKVLVGLYPTSHNLVKYPMKILLYYTGILCILCSVSLSSPSAYAQTFSSKPTASSSNPANSYLKEGNLIKGSKSDVYVISLGKRQLIPDEATFKALGYKQENVQQILEAQLSLIPELPPLISITQITFKDGSLVKGSGTAVYAIYAGGRRLVANETIFKAYGYKWENVQTISDLELKSIPEYSALPAYNSKFPEGTLIKGTGPAVYIINGGSRRLIPDEPTFNVLNYKWEKIQTLSDRELNSISELPQIPSKLISTLKDGSLIKGSGPAIYVINFGRRRLIPNEATFNALGYKWEKIQNVSDQQLSAIPELSPLPAY